MSASTQNFHAQLRSLMNSANIPGLSIFSLQGGVEQVATFGVRNMATQQAIDAQTRFEAASLSKPVVAHAALQLVDAGKLDLDQPLSDLIGPVVPGDPAAARITARHVLSHTTGLPNWRSSEFLLRTYFPPGSRFSYSGEGFVILQSAMEHVTGEPLESVMNRLVLGPFGMDASSFVWLESFGENFASPHDDAGQVRTRSRLAKASAASSLLTTAADYGRFVVAALAGARLKGPTARHWLSPQVNPPKARSQALEDQAPETDTDVAWGLGWGLEPGAGALFHWGYNPGAIAFVLAVPAERSAFAVFINCDAGAYIVPRIAELIMPGRHPSFSWLKWQ